MTANSFPKTRFALCSSALLFLAFAASPRSYAQNEGVVVTQVLVRAESKENIIPAATAVTLQLNSKVTPLSSLTPVLPSGIQVALLVDDGLSRSFGIQLNDLKNFANQLPQGTEIFIGYMRNGTVEPVVQFTTDHQDAGSKVRLPLGLSGISASPYFCLSEFVRHWPGANPGEERMQHKARFIMMVTNGVDPYNGSTSIMNQNSPYVTSAQVDAQRAGVSVSSIYYSGAGFRGGGSFSGQSYLGQVADATGGKLYNLGSINPVSLTPLFQQFVHDLSQTYIATFMADASAGHGGKEHLIRIKLATSTPKLKLRTSENVRPGNLESSIQ